MRQVTSKNFCEDLFFFFLESTCAVCPWSLALASSIPVLGLESVCPRKGCPWPWPWPRIFFVSLALSLVSSTPPLLCRLLVFKIFARPVHCSSPLHAVGYQRTKAKKSLLFRQFAKSAITGRESVQEAKTEKPKAPWHKPNLVYSAVRGAVALKCDYWAQSNYGV